MHDLAKFSRAMRMNRPGDFSRVFRQGQRTGGGGLTILTVENSVGHPRLGLAIAKKHIKLASQRNRLKRIIRESFRQHQSRFSNIDIVVLSRPDIVKRDSTQIWASLERHWLKVVAQWQKS
jgi:ribonuclease P protein component